jgi:hypothetical protein
LCFLVPYRGVPIRLRSSRDGWPLRLASSLARGFAACEIFLAGYSPATAALLPTLGAERSPTVSVLVALLAGRFFTLEAAENEMSGRPRGPAKRGSERAIARMASTKARSRSRNRPNATDRLTATFCADVGCVLFVSATR